MTKIPECIFCHCDMQLIGKPSVKKRRIERYSCPVCDYKTTDFIGFGFNPFFPIWLSVGYLYRQEEDAKSGKRSKLDRRDHESITDVD